MLIHVTITLYEDEELALEPHQAGRAVLRALKGKVGEDALSLTVGFAPKSIQLGTGPPSPEPEVA